MHPCLVFELKPELTILIDRLLCFHVKELIISFYLFFYLGLVFFDTKHQVVFDNYRSPKSPGTYLVLVDPYHTVITRETEFFIGAYQTHFMLRYIYALLGNLQTLLLDVFTPSGNLR